MVQIQVKFDKISLKSTLGLCNPLSNQSWILERQNLIHMGDLSKMLIFQLDS